MSFEWMLCWIESHPGLASWVQAVGSILAIAIAIHFSIRDSRLRRVAEAEAMENALERAIASVQDSVRRVYSAKRSIKKAWVDDTLNLFIQRDLEQAKQHVKESMGVPGASPQVYGVLFRVRTSIEDFMHAFDAHRESERLDDNPIYKKKGGKFIEVIDESFDLVEKSVGDLERMRKKKRSAKAFISRFLRRG